MEVVTGEGVGCGTQKKITEWGCQYVGFEKFEFGNRSLHECVIFCSIPLLCVNIEIRDSSCTGKCDPRAGVR